MFIGTIRIVIINNGLIKYKLDAILNLPIYYIQTILTKL